MSSLRILNIAPPPDPSRLARILALQQPAEDRQIDPPGHAKLILEPTAHPPHQRTIAPTGRPAPNATCDSQLTNNEMAGMTQPPSRSPHESTQVVYSRLRPALCRSQQRHPNASKAPSTSTPMAKPLAAQPPAEHSSSRSHFPTAVSSNPCQEDLTVPC